MPEHKCRHCEKSFNAADALAMHTQAKHPADFKKPHVSGRTKKRIRNWTIVVIIAALAVWGIIRLANSSQETNAELNFEAPKRAIHWHPHLTIRIDGVKQAIPVGIGMETAHLPIHTHESDGTLHMENNRPSKQTVTVGYFFKAWGKAFNKECIFDYCTDKGTLKMQVNGKENFDFENYFMQDKDEILIEYTSFGGKENDSE